MSGEVTSRLAYDLHMNVMPRHPRYLFSIIHLFVWLFKSIKILDSGIGVVFARPKLAVIGIFRCVRHFEASQFVVHNRMLRSVPSTKA